MYSFFKNIVTSSVIIFSVSSLTYSATVSAETHIALCNTCSTSLDYSQKAVQTDLIPGQTKDVYVVNIERNETRVFQVEVMLTGSGFGDQGINLAVTPISGNSATLSDINAATDKIQEMDSKLNSSISAQDLGILNNHSSAIDLVGPSNAGLARNNLKNRLQEHLRDFWSAQTISLADSIKAVLDKLIGEGAIGANGAVITTYPDGTKVIVRIKSIDWAINIAWDTDIVFDFEVDQDSVTHEDLGAVPQDPSEFYGLNQGGLEPDIARALSDLAFRFGIDVSSPSNPEACNTTMTCTHGQQSSCTLTLSC